MKREFLISRLDEPNIAHTYVCESDQNLLNNIRVLCTRQPETLRYFVPEELFWEIKNGETVAITAECYDEYGRWMFTVDPLKVLSGQLWDEKIYLEDDEGLDIRLRIEGYALPAPGESQTELMRPLKYRKTGSGAPQNKAGRTEGRAAYGNPGARSAEGGSVRGRHAAAGSGTRGYTEAAKSARGGSKVQEEDPDFRRRKKSPVKAILLTMMILAAAAAVWFMRDTSVRRFENSIEAAHYANAVTIYNGEILGHEAKEQKADPMAREAVNTVRDRYMDELCGYQDTCTYLNILTGFEKDELSELAEGALAEVELYEVSSASFKEGVNYMENREYVAAIEAFLKIEESSTVYGEAQKNVKACVDQLLKIAESPETEAEYLAAIEQIEAAIALLPENTELKQSRDNCLSKYHTLVRSNAFREADQMAADGDFEGAFARIAQALEILPEDEQLTQKAEDLRAAFVAYVTREAVDRVDAGDFDSAYEIVEEASELYSCEALDSLYEQIEEGENGPDLETSEFTAAKVTFTEYPGELKGAVKKQEYTVKAAGGPCSFFLTGVEGTLRAQIVIKGPDGAELLRQTGLVNGSEVNCTLEKDKTYTVSVEAAEGEGKYVMLFGQNKEAEDVSDYDLIRDSVEFKGQYNTYTFVPENSGTYRFDLKSADKELALKTDIYDARNGKIFGDNLSDGNGATLELNAGEAYTIYASQIGKIGEYALAIGKQESSEDVTGKCIVPGAITYRDQKKGYTFTAVESGKYRITISNMEDSCSVKMYVYSQLGDRLEGADEISSGDRLSVIFKEGQNYQIRLTQQSGTGNYTITMVKE